MAGDGALGGSRADRAIQWEPAEGEGTAPTVGPLVHALSHPGCTASPGKSTIPPVWARKGAPLVPAGWSGQHRLAGRTLGTRAAGPGTGTSGPRARSAGADHHRTWDGPVGERRVGYSVRTRRAGHCRTARCVRETVRLTGCEGPLAGSKQPTHAVETAALHHQAMCGDGWAS